MRTAFSAVVAAGLLLGAALPSSAQSVENARALYAGADYPEALAELVRLEDGAAPEAMREILEYRALCLLALGRTTETEQAVERLVATDPNYAPNEVERPPQLRAIVKSVRQRQLPGLARARYAAAKAYLDAGNVAAAAEGFEQVLTLLAHDETVAGLGAEDAADLRTLATSFRDLATTRTGRARPAEPTPVATSGTSSPATATAVTPPKVAMVYDADNAEVVAPVPVAQQLPPYRAVGLVQPQLGLLVVVIDEAGRVESAALNRKVHPAYDRVLLERAQTWRYVPATLNGQPVKFRKVIEVRVAAN